MNREKINKIAKEIMRVVDVDPELFNERCIIPSVKSWRFAGMRAFYRKIAKWHLKEIAKIEDQRQKGVF